MKLIPKVSVVIPSFNSKETINDCLWSLTNNNVDFSYEIIIIDSSTDNTCEIIENKYKNIYIYRFTDRKYPESARNIGIEKSLGEIIAFLDADCVAEKYWLKEIVKNHSKYPDLVIGGTVANGNTKTSTGWAAYFSQLSCLMPGGRRRWVGNMGAANISYKRRVFELFGYYLEGTYSADTEFHWRVGQSGHKLLFIPSIIVYHRYLGDLTTYLLHEYERGQSFALVRTKYQKFTLLKRVLYATSFPLIAMKLIARVILNNLSNRYYLKNFLSHLPLTTLGVICWSIGESTGYIKQKASVNVKS